MANRMTVSWAGLAALALLPLSPRVAFAWAPAEGDYQVLVGDWDGNGTTTVGRCPEPALTSTSSRHSFPSASAGIGVTCDRG